MPLIKPNPSEVLGNVNYLKQDPNIEVGVTDALSAAFQTDNLVGSFLNSTDAWMQDAQTEAMEGYNVWDDIQGYELYADSFIGVDNPAVTKALKTKIDKEQMNRQILNDAGGLGIGASVIATILDPVQIALAWGTGGLGFVGKGASTASRVMRASSVAMATETAIETGLQLTQETRTPIESALNVGGATLMVGGGTLLGNIVRNNLKGVGSGTFNEMSENLVKSLNEPFNPTSVGGADMHGSVGAMRAGERVSDSQLLNAKGMVTFTDKTKIFSTPILRTLNSEFPEVRSLAQGFFENAFLMNKNMKSDVKLASKVALNETVNLLSKDAKFSKSFASEFNKRLNALPKDERSVEAAAGIFNAMVDVIPEVPARGNRSQDAIKAGIKSDFKRVFKREAERDAQRTEIAAETLIKNKTDIRLGASINTQKQAYKAYSNKTPKAQKLKEQDFYLKVGKAMRNGDIHEIPEIQAAAKGIRNIYNEVLDDALEAGLITEAQRQSPSAFQRVWNVDAINSNYNELLDTLSTNLEKVSERTAERIRIQAGNLKNHEIKKVTSVSNDINELFKKSVDLFSTVNGESVLKQGAKITPEYEEFFEKVFKKTTETLDAYKVNPDIYKGMSSDIISRFDLIQRAVKPIYDIAGSLNEKFETLLSRASKLDDTEATELSRGIIENIRRNGGWFDTEGAELALGKRFGFQEDDFIPLGKESLISKFLIEDVDYVSNRFVREMTANTEMKRALNNKGYDSWNQAIQEIRNKAGTDKKKLQKASEDIRDLNAMRDRLKGTRNRPVDPTSKATMASKGLLALNTATMLGGVVLSSIPDVGRHVMRNGLGKTLKGAKFWASDLAKGSYAKKDLQKMGVALENTLNARAAAMSDLVQDASMHSKFYKNVEKGTNAFFKYTFVNAWNDAQKTIAGFIVQDEILDVATKVAGGKKVSPKRLAKIAQLGLGEAELRQVAEQFQKVGQKDKGLLLANITEWDDKALAEMFSAAIRKDTDITIVTPGVGDKPLWFDANQIAPHLFQFKSFAVAAHNRSTIAGLQQGDANFVLGSSIMAGLGMGSYLLKEMLNKPDEEIDTSWKRLVFEGIDRSGLVNHLYYAQMFDKGLQINFFEEGSRFQAQSQMEALIGPSYGTAKNLREFAEMVANGEVTDGGVSALRRLAPGNNITGVRNIFDAIEEEITE